MADQGSAALSSAKRWWTGSHRVRLPSATLSALLPHLPFYGITRLADLTGLDRVGVPVWSAIRPRTRSLSVSQGKGVDATQAKVSAIVEAIELWSAERIQPDDRLGGGEHVVAAHDLASGAEALVPFSKVTLDSRVQARQRPTGSSNGLAGGNIRIEAVLHGLCELIERDALARTMPTAGFAGGLSRIDPASVVEPVAREIVHSLADAGVVHAVWHVPACVDVPVFLCHVMDDERIGDDGRGWAHGSGCHLDPTIAWLRAVTEALQARLTHISGARDDTGWDRYAPIDPDRMARQRSILQQRGQQVRLPEPSGTGGAATLVDDVALLMEALLRRGRGPVHCVDLDSGPAPIAVVKLIAPHLREPRH